MTYRLEILMPVTIDAYDIATHFSSRDELMRYLLGVDAVVADTGFTEQLIKRLVQSLRGDLSDEEFAGLIKELQS